jgi:hypothetical protein
MVAHLVKSNNIYQLGSIILGYVLQTYNDKQNVRHIDAAATMIKGYESHSAQRQCYDMLPQIMYQQMVTVINTNNYPAS